MRTEKEEAATLAWRYYENRRGKHTIVTDLRNAVLAEIRAEFERLSSEDKELKFSNAGDGGTAPYVGGSTDINPSTAVWPTLEDLRKRWTPKPEHRSEYGEGYASGLEGAYARLTPIHEARVRELEREIQARDELRLEAKNAAAARLSEPRKVTRRHIASARAAFNDSSSWRLTSDEIAGIARTLGLTVEGEGG